MSLEQEARRKLCRVLTPSVLAWMQQDLVATALKEMALQPGRTAEIAAEIVQRLRGIDYVIRELSTLGISLPEGGGDGIAEAEWNGDGRAQSRAETSRGDTSAS
jgi:hypothetical protein